MGTSLPGGWVQINNTVVPYVTRRADDTILNLVPIDVIKYGAGLLMETATKTLSASESECNMLTKRCQSANLNFTFRFSDNVQLMDIFILPKVYGQKVFIHWLPDEEPFAHTKTAKPEMKMAEQNGDLANRVGSDFKELPKDIESHYNEEGKWFQTSHANSCKTNVMVHPLDPNNKNKSKEIDITDSNNGAVMYPGIAQLEPLDLSTKSQTSKVPPSNFIPAPSPSNQKKSVQICPARLFGRKIPCIIKGGIQYVLVETLRRAYFPQCSHRAFMFMINRSINPFVYDLEQSDIDVITTFSHNPTSLSISSKVISLHDAGKILPMFRSFLKKVSQQRNARQFRNADAARTPDKPKSHGDETASKATRNKDQVNSVDATPTQQVSCKAMEQTSEDNCPEGTSKLNDNQSNFNHNESRKRSIAPSRKARPRNLHATLTKLHNQHMQTVILPP